MCMDGSWNRRKREADCPVREGTKVLSRIKSKQETVSLQETKWQKGTHVANKELTYTVQDVIKRQKWTSPLYDSHLLRIKWGPRDTKVPDLTWNFPERTVSLCQSSYVHKYSTNISVIAVPRLARSKLGIMHCRYRTTTCHRSTPILTDNTMRDCRISFDLNSEKISRPRYRLAYLKHTNLSMLTRNA